MWEPSMQDMALTALLGIGTWHPADAADLGVG